ncbi:GNAT family N-acetyltransferase [Chondrinema litorale]|uniref:GNAT family N-acetyltransferase n=1 Tax=Chondrinema litorale TaxID=2994555 RepID=UPI00254289CB|nr:GNAT family N-acetyltransferase [Chondrinema litorale]UZR92669.1 GNAT family N-acetyltransferase [Chondrinema litorale]
MNKIKLTNSLNIKFTNIPENHFDQLHRTFQLSFRNYHTTINTSHKALKNRFNRLGVRLSQSVAAYHNEELIAFILQSEGVFNNKKTAYNAGTGVLPEYRGHKISRSLYEYAFDLLKQDSFEQCILEVITQNIPALKVYNQLGFFTVRDLICYKAANVIQKSHSKINIHLQKLENRIPEWSLYQTFFDFAPTWQNSTTSVIRNFDEEIIIEAHYKSDVVGIIIFDPDYGSISQIAVHKGFRRKGIGTQLLRAASAFIVTPNISIINVDGSFADANAFFINNGFKEIIRQKEMIKEF